MLITRANILEIDKLKKKMSKKFAMKDLSTAKQILRMRIIRDKVVLKLSQKEYAKEVLSRFNTDRAKLMNTPLASHFHLSNN